MVDDPLLAALDADIRPEVGAAFLDIIARYLAGTARGEGPVTTPLSAEDLVARFDQPLPDQEQPLATVLERLERDVLPHVTRLTHPMYMGHQVSAPLPAAIWIESLISAINNSTAVQEMAPPVTVIEHQLVRWLSSLVGWSDQSGGTLTSGGTEATFTALLAARAAAMPEAWEQGVGADPPVVVYGETAHYAVPRAVAQLGLGLRHGIAIPSREHRMDLDALTATLARLATEGKRIMAVVATAGSTPTGSFDDLDAIGRLCEERGIWLHVDGAHGATALFSDAHRHRVAGIHRARSLAWDPHKTMLLPLSAGMVLVRNGADLDQAFLQRAPYLFHAGGARRVWDLGPRSFQCSRRGDALKLWFALQRYGARNVGALYDRLCETAQALHRELAAHPDFEPLHHPESNILCFRYRGLESAGEASQDRVHFELRQRYNRSGAGWITMTVLGGRRVLRVTIMNPRTRLEHLQQLLAGLEHEARGLAASGLPLPPSGAGA